MLIDCKECKMRVRADNLVNDFTGTSEGDAMSNDELISFIKENKIMQFFLTQIFSYQTKKKIQLSLNLFFKYM